MNYLFTQFSRIKELLRDKFILLLLDYDGTLTPIVETPEKAVISKKAKELLQKLSKNHNCKLAIISGRSLKDIKNIVGIKDIIYAGNHGLEIEGPEIKFRTPVSPRSKEVIGNVYKRITNKLSRIKGVLIEDKGLAISAHYRRVNNKDVPEFKRIFGEITAPFVIRDKIKITKGKKVFEIKPPVKWTKGSAALWFLARQKFALGEDNVFPVYIGDDITDEDAFRALKNKGLTIFVGEPVDSAADYYVKNTKEAIKFLKQILKLK
ncbi:MAG: trehalose-phosphatase [Candidatus Omnitrophica bacterium CG08_land_8_20_14_0_20_41_16]|uniref:Trehalose 6-phosphate phosphatase n=1 Tax=Candidatus Sherwoodlollariibacterium unditelluris TaxID=1974757 RepID=A0A2G9YJF7_9BACT|nr:MAG: trehalose-phosphatase [Candidatus Omnitrophica bacterium CG23_combo_of_CG06-09_8_20_14_all_41_10]PIS33627.1 MAG: trehalose-phosphatase [Candidatus Omnitrophica bacterium CG08_land_8_20_14_0_20_41_16]